MSALNYFKKIWALIKIISLFFLCAALIINLYLIFAQLSDRSNLPRIFGFAQVIVISGSMQPAIEAGDLIIIKEQAKYEKNDVVTYRKDQSLITHRIVEADQSEVITKGDANNTNDEPVSLSDIEGKVILRLPGAGNIILFLRKPTGILTVSCIVLLLFMIPRWAEWLKQLKMKGVSK